MPVFEEPARADHPHVLLMGQFTDEVEQDVEPLGPQVHQVGQRVELVDQHDHFSGRRDPPDAFRDIKRQPQVGCETGEASRRPGRSRQP